MLWLINITLLFTFSNILVLMTASCTVTIKPTVPNCSGPANHANPDLSSVQVKYGFLYDFCTTSALTSFATQLSTLYNIWKHFLVIHTTPRVLCRQIFYFGFIIIKIRFLKLPMKYLFLRKIMILVKKYWYFTRKNSGFFKIVWSFW